MARSMINWDVQAVRKDFPGLKQSVNGHPLVYLDTAATAQKPRQVLAAMDDYYQNYAANVHRGVHALSEKATTVYESARETVRAFIHAASVKEIIFTRGTTEAINIVAQCFGQSQCKLDDEIVLTTMEHHANIVPWQLLSQRMGVRIRIVPLLENGDLDLKAYAKLLTKKTKLVCVTQTSNVLGTVNPVKNMAAMAHEKGIPILLDGAQAVVHGAVDVQDLGCDFYAFSGHKLYGPTGVGVLYVREAMYDCMTPYQGGGDMIQTVSFEQSTFREPPLKYEAGTPNIAGVIGLKAAIEYVTSLGMKNIAAYEKELRLYADQAFAEVEGVYLLGKATERAPVYSFVVDGIHAHDLSILMDQRGFAMRDGHHCAMPLMRHYGVSATARVSLGFYNTFEEVDRFIETLIVARDIFGD